MTAPVYATDLASVSADTTKGTIYRQDSTSALTTTGCLGTLTHAEPTGSTAGGLPAVDTDFFILGVATMDKSFNATGVGGLGSTTTNAASLPTDGAFMFWSMFTAPNSVSNKAGGGIQCLVGSSVANYYRYYVDGDDTHPYGGWKCTPVNPAVTASATQGTPTGTRQFFGVAYNVDNAVAKGNPAALGAMRFGRCYLECINGDVNGYATFTGAGIYNDYNDGTNGWNRLGLFQLSNGSYQMQGLFRMGSAATPVDFRDSNKSIVIQKTEFVTVNFNMFEVVNAGSRVDWTGISISSLSSVSRGRFVMTDNGDVNKDICTFTDMGTFSYLSGATVLGTTYRRCDAVTPGGGTLTGCTIESSHEATGGLVINAAADMSVLSKLNLTNNAKAIKITAAGTYTFNGHQFSGNTVQVDFTGTGTCTINPTNGCNVSQAACTASGGGTITVNAVQVQLSFTVSPAITGYEWRLYIEDVAAGKLGTTELAGQETATASTQSYSFVAGDAGTAVVIQIIADGYEESLTYLPLPSSSQSYTISLEAEENA